MLLCKATKDGNIKLARRLIDNETDINQKDYYGNTPLHIACQRGYTEIAALLLSKGADFTIQNSKGLSALSPEFTNIEIIHSIRQKYQRLPVAPFDSTSHDKLVNKYVNQLNDNGLIKISGLIDHQQLTQLKKDFKYFIKKVRIDRFLKLKNMIHYDEKEYWHKKHRAYVTNDAIQYSDELIKICSNPVLTEIANYYLGKPAYIKRVYAMRYLNFKPLFINQFGWHNDMEDRQMKVLLLLTDVGEKDQYMEYVKSTHMVFHPYQRYLKNNLEFEYYKNSIQSFEILKTIGIGGDIFLFDSNGMHRGVRSKGRIRDAFFIEFTAAKNVNNIWGSEARSPPALNAKNDFSHPLHSLLNTTPKWIRTRDKKSRVNPTWIESLDDPKLWI